MQLDLSLLQNIRSDFSSAGGGSIQRSHAAGQKLNPSGTATNENDFRSNLERANGYRETVSQRKNESDATNVPTENRSPTMANAENVHQIKKEVASADNGTPRVPEEENKKTTEDVSVIPLVPIGSDAVDSPIDNGFGTKVIAFDLPIEKPSEVSPTVERRDGTAEPLTVAAKPEAPASGAVASGPVVSMVFEGENISRAAVPSGSIKEEPEVLNPANTGKPSLTNAELPVGLEASGANTDHPGDELSNKPSSEGLRIPSKVDNPSVAAENTSEIAARKTLAQEQAGSERQSSESPKSAGKIPPIPETAPANEGPHRKVLMNDSMGRAAAARIADLTVENEHGSRPQQNSVAQNDTPGTQEGSSASAPKTSPDFDQNVKMNDLASSSQRPVAGDGNTPVSAETLDLRPSAPKADVLNQIVDRAVFKLSNGQSEVRIDLKPDFLGPVRLQIITESHQVSLRILAESSAVKEIIEGSISQLKNDLQTQGLKVDEIDVTVAKDFNGYNRRSNSAAHGEHGRRGFASKEQNLPENERPDSRRIPARLDSQAGGIDYFA